MKKDNKFVQCLVLFLTFLKVGALTFGGGYAMIPIIQKEVVEKRKWMLDSEILDVLAISESTPGPIAINTATYVGFRVAGFWGSFFATLGLIVPSYVIISIISMFYKTFMEISWINSAFRGIRAGVVILLINAIIKLGKSIKFDIPSIILLCLACGGILFTTFFDISIMIGTFELSLAIVFILIGLVYGVIATAINNKGGKKE